jgi:hypothetical protein
VTRIAIALLAAALAAAAILAACGKQGDLERPNPLWGPQHRADVAAQQRQAAATASNAAASNRAIPSQNPATAPYTDPGPIHDNPIPGARNPNPSGNPSPP